MTPGFDPAAWVRQATDAGLHPVAIVDDHGERGVLLPESGQPPTPKFKVPDNPNQRGALFDYLAATGRLLDTRFSLSG